MFHLVLGICIVLFGIIIGGVGIATAGIGIGIPMFPLGVYMTWRGWRIYKHAKNQEDGIEKEAFIPLEKTSRGKVFIGFLLILVGIGTSAIIIGVPIIIYGAWMIYAEMRACKLSKEVPQKLINSSQTTHRE